MLSSELSLISECKIMAKYSHFKVIFPNLTGIFPYALVGKTLWV